MQPAGDAAHAPLALLDPFERTAFRFMDTLVQEGSALSVGYSRWVGQNWIWAGIGNRFEIHGLERLAGVRPTDGVLLVANHRSFFDLYLLFTALYRYTPLRQPVYCPVRADFFYQKPLGILVNLLAGGGRMYPPVFREPTKAAFNKWSVARVVELLRGGSVLVGMHPEGTRNKSDDAYAALPAQPGVGKLVMDAWPVVVPAFINGLSNDIVGEIAANWRRASVVERVLGRPEARRPITAVFGAPVDLAPFHGMSNRLASHKRVADRLLEIVYALGDEERRLRHG